MVTICFGQYGHHQVLKYVVGKLLLFIMLFIWNDCVFELSPSSGILKKLLESITLQVL
jgi:MFS superfamily sulfate permease-like transporter